MKRLWKYIPPCYSDTQGFQAVMKETDGLGIIDDSSVYHPIRLPGEKSPEGGRGHGNHDAGSNVICSDLRVGDIITGTHDKLMQAFDDAKDTVDPKFVLLCNAPSSSMISSDLEGAADEINEKSGLPAGYVNVHGDKDYLYGISLTLEAMAKLLLSKQETIPDTVNILGANVIDWPEDGVAALKDVLAENGFTVQSCWGSAGMKADDLRRASSAAANFVVNVSGLRTAKYMEEEFGIPYVAGAPFGKDECDRLIAELKTVAGGENDKAAGESKEAPAGFSGKNLAGCRVLVTGEQFQANAIRKALLKRGAGDIKVLSFFETSKEYYAEGDKKIAGEDELAAITGEGGFDLIAANPDYRPAARGNAKWINLPNSGMGLAAPVPSFNMTGSALDKWLDEQLDAVM